MRYLNIYLLFLSLLVPLSSNAAEDQYTFIVNKEIKTKVLVNGESALLSGRANMVFSTNPKDYENGVLTIEQANIVLYDFPQQKIGGRGDETGVLGFATDKRKSKARYDAKSQTISLYSSGQLSLPILNERPRAQYDEKMDSYKSDLISAALTADIKLDEALDLQSGQTEIAKLSATMNLALQTDNAPKFKLIDFTVDIYDVGILIDWTRLYVFKAVHELCLQPVRFQRLFIKYNWPIWNISLDYTGEGLDFGMPQARKEWGKANVIFKVRPWKTISNPDFFTVDANNSGFLTAEESSVINTVNDADCIEMFFIDRFSPEGTHGGGATVFSGTANAKIITSDRNEFYGIDATHLAHELGHVMNLSHPGGSFPDGSSNTLMCPSGFKNDNPKRNSVENKNNISNPLFVTKFIFSKTTPLDCTNDADCGACP